MCKDGTTQLINYVSHCGLLFGAGGVNQSHAVDGFSFGHWISILCCLFVCFHTKGTTDGIGITSPT